MARVVAMYKSPKDPIAFDKYYFETHVPIAKRIPGLRKYEVSRGAVASPAGPSGVHLVAILHFDDMAVIARADPPGGPGHGRRFAELRHRRRRHSHVRSARGVIQRSEVGGQRSEVRYKVSAVAILISDI